MKNLPLLLSCVVTASLTAVLRKSIVGKMEPTQMDIASGFMHVLLSFIAYFALGTKYKPVEFSTWGLIAVHSILGFFTVLAFTYAIKDSNNLGASSAITSASPMLTLLLSAAIYGEKIDFKTVVGMLMILSGVIILSFKR